MNEYDPRLHEAPDEMLASCRKAVARHHGLVSHIDRDDLVQEACVAALKAAGSFDPAKCKPMTFTWTAAHRRMIDLHRRRRQPSAQIPQNTESGAICRDDILAVCDRALEAAEVLLGGKVGQRASFPLYRLCAAIIVRDHLRDSSRGFVMRLNGWPELRQRLGLRRVPVRRTFDLARLAIKRRLRMRTKARDDRFIPTIYSDGRSGVCECAGTLPLPFIGLPQLYIPLIQK